MKRLLWAWLLVLPTCPLFAQQVSTSDTNASRLQQNLRHWPITLGSPYHDQKLAATTEAMVVTMFGLNADEAVSFHSAIQNTRSLMTAAQQSTTASTNAPQSSTSSGSATSGSSQLDTGLATNIIGFLAAVRPETLTRLQALSGRGGTLK